MADHGIPRDWRARHALFQRSRAAYGLPDTSALARARLAAESRAPARRLKPARNLMARRRTAPLRGEGDLILPFHLVDKRRMSATELCRSAASNVNGS